MKAKCLFHLSLVTLFVFGVIASGISVASTEETPIVYVDPPYNSTPAGQYFTINIYVANVTNLNSWRITLYIKKAVLETNSSMIEEGTFLSQNGVYPTVLTSNQDAAKLYWFIGSHIEGDWAVNGSGTLASITLKVIKEGESHIALTETYLWEPDSIPIDHASKGGYFDSEEVEVINEIEVDGQNFTIITATNSSVSPVPFNINIEQREISFNVIGLEGMTGYCNVSIPKSFMNCSDPGDWAVWVDDVSPPYFPPPTDNTTHTFVYFTYATSTHTVRIKSTNMVPEFPAIVFLPLFIIAAITATIIAKKAWSIGNNYPRN